MEVYVGTKMSEASDHLTLELRAICELTDMDNQNWTQVPCKNDAYA